MPTARLKQTILLTAVLLIAALAATMAVMMPAWAQTQEPWQAPVTGLTVTAGDNAGELNIS